MSRDKGVTFGGLSILPDTLADRWIVIRMRRLRRWLSVDGWEGGQAKGEATRAKLGPVSQPDIGKGKC